MAMQATAIRFAPEEKAWIQRYTDFVGKPFSDAVRRAVLELIKDAVGVQEYNEALADDEGLAIPSMTVWLNTATPWS